MFSLRVKKSHFLNASLLRTCQFTKLSNRSNEREEPGSGLATEVGHGTESYISTVVEIEVVEVDCANTAKGRMQPRKKSFGVEPTEKADDRKTKNYTEEGGGVRWNELKKVAQDREEWRLSVIFPDSG